MDTEKPDLQAVVERLKKVVYVAGGVVVDGARDVHDKGIPGQTGDHLGVAGSD